MSQEKIDTVTDSNLDLTNAIKNDGETLKGLKGEIKEVTADLKRLNKEAGAITKRVEKHKTQLAKGKEKLKALKAKGKKPGGK